MRSHRLIYFLGFLLIHSSCAKEEIGEDLEPARKGHAVLAFHSDLFPLIRSFYYSPQGPDPNGAPVPCGEWQLVDGDSSLFPESSNLRYRYKASDSCSGRPHPFKGGEVTITFLGEWDEGDARVRVEGEKLEGRRLRMTGSFWIDREAEGLHRMEWLNTEYLYNEESIRVTGEMEVKRIRGAGSDSVLSDDAFLYDPDLKGKGIGEASYMMKAHEPIERDMTCAHPWDGILWVKPRDLGGRELLYGGGNGCPEKGRVSVNGKEKEFPLF